MTIASRRTNLKEIMRTELPVSVGKGAIESIIGLDETNYELNLDQDLRLLTLENNETIYQVFSYVGTSASGQIPVYQESSIFDIYGDGLVDAIAVKADANQNPLEEIVTDSGGAQITVTSLIDNLNNTANFTLSGTPTENACIIYFLKIKNEFKANIPEGNVIPPAINVPTAPFNVLLVAKAGGDFATIKDAVDSITDNDETHRYLVSVAPGIYTENNPIQGKSYVNVEVQSMHTVRIVAENANFDLFLGFHLFYLIGFSFVNVVGASNYAVNHSVPGEMVVKDCVFTDCSNGVLVNDVNALMNVLDCALYTPTGTINIGVDVQAGNTTISFLKVVATSTIDTVVKVSGSSSILSPDTIQSASPNVNKAFHFIDGARVSGFGIKLVNMVDGLVVSGNNTDVRLDAFKIFNAQTDGYRVDNIGIGINVALLATTIVDSTNLNFNILNPDSITTGGGFSQLDKGFIIDGAKLFASILDISEDDEGFNILGELHVGSPVGPAESVFGEGDSYTTGMLVYTFDGSSYVDVSTAAKTASASTFTYPNLNVNTAIYIASSVLKGGDMLRHFGIKIKVSTLAVFGAGNIVTEYWNGSIWVEMVVMEVESTDNYYPQAKNIFQKVGSCQIRYNSEIQNDNWTKIDPMSLGITYYWIRYRIEIAAITTAPIFEQWKLHSSRFEINADGWIEYYGKARPQGQLNLNMAGGRPFEGAMQSQTLYISQNIGNGFTSNKFTGTGDILGVSGFLPFDLDTSSPIKLTWGGHPNATGTYEWTVRWGWLKDGDSITYAEPGSPITNSNSTVISKAATLNQKVTFEALLDVSNMISRRENDFGDELWISIQPTILPGNFSLASSQALYTKWSEGGHI